MHRPRARDLGIPFDGNCGPRNAITDVEGVEVGYVTLIDGDVLERGSTVVRTGVTMIFPRGKLSKDPVFAGTFVLNGAGEMTGAHWLNESGFLESPIALTSTHAVGAVHSAIIRWQLENDRMFGAFSLPVVSETFDGVLSDHNATHISDVHVRAAIANAACAPIAEGNVGGGTGMTLFGWKGGSGTASRIVETAVGTYNVGVFVQANFGRAEDLIVTGVPIGKFLMPNSTGEVERGSVVVVVACDAPLLPHQLVRLSRRAAIGVARTGGNAGNSSGDLMLSFSTANPGAAGPATAPVTCETLTNDVLDPLFRSVAHATEEAIINALVGAETMCGLAGRVVAAIPHTTLLDVLRRHARTSYATS